MSFNHLPTSKPATRRSKQEPVFCVGWRAFVNWRHSVGQPPAPVPLADQHGNPLANDLADGEEVEIVAWHPRAREGATYQVRRLVDGREWWIAAVYLRRQRHVDASHTPPAEAPRR
ncbi:MAG: hypothetical protein HY699_14080 [Deltaproteobacteria bacterium]|nr:hypothetical protein [Deltaproteobacteria bacterium]